MTTSEHEWQERHAARNSCHYVRMTHAVVALALPGVVAFDLSTAAQVFGHPEEDEYSFEVVTTDGRQVPSSTGFQIAGVGDPSSLRQADTIVIPGYSPPHHAQ